MTSFFKKVERFIVNLFIILLIILISFQILMKNEIAYKRIKDVEYLVKGFIDPDHNVVKVSKVTTEISGYIIVDLLQDLSLPQVWLIKNGERVANFAEGIVFIQINDGDFLSIDGSFFSEPLWFEITSLSSSIRTWQVGQQYRVNGNVISLGVVQFYDKL